MNKYQIPLYQITLASILIALFLNPYSYPLAIALAAAISLQIFQSLQFQFKQVSQVMEQLEAYKISQQEKDQALVSMQAEVARLSTQLSFRK